MLFLPIDYFYRSLPNRYFNDNYLMVKFIVDIVPS
ncbi:uncharacterized protein METZ01_LOCUS264433 [marine metagenome]|uniref:Uncharacterized protein n=1 Tax=marine metagenome TaxID=408172 RepID=A0A382JIR0_9ZZZZ